MDEPDGSGPGCGDRAAGGTAPASASAGTGVALGSPKAVSVTDTGLAAGTTYSYAVFTRDTTGNTTTTGVPVTTSTLPPVPTLAITTSSLPDGVQGAPYSATLAATGGTGLTWSVSAGTLPTGLSLAPATGVIGGTPTGVGAATFTVKVTAAGGATATRPLGLTVVDATADWPQPGHDAGARSWNGGDDLINPGNVGGLVETYSLRSGSSWAPVISGATTYVAGEVPDRDGTFAVMALELATGDLDWYAALPGACQGGPLAVTGSAVVVNCGSAVVAYRLAAPHDVLWSTADTDPGVATQNLRIAGTSAVVWSADRVLAYRLADGQRLWQQLLPAGAQSLYDVAVDGNTVVVAYSDRLRALRLDTGAQLWSKPVGRFGFGGVVIADGWVYTNNDGGAQRHALADGSPGWSTQQGTGIYQVLGADADTVYMWRAEFNFGPPNPSVVLALKSSDGSVRWATHIPSRVQSFAITRRLVWVISTEIYSQGRHSDLIALDRVSGAQVKSVGFDDNTYGTAAFGNGYVLMPQAGSFGNGTPARLRAFSLASPLPTITTRVVPTGRVGVGYSTPLQATGGTGTLTWAVTAGTLPTGLSLSSSGLLAGTPTAAADRRVTVRVTDARGRGRSEALDVEVVDAANADWTSEGGDVTRAGWNRGETVVGLDNAAQLAFRWKTSTPAVEGSGTMDRQPVIVGDRLYDVDILGDLNAWSTTGTTANRAPLWTKTAVGATPDGRGNHYPDSPAYANGVLYMVDSLGYLEAVNATTGAQVWRKQLVSHGRVPADLLVVGDKVVKLDGQFALRAYKTSDGTPAWGGLTVPLGGNELYGSAVLATDGTRVFVVAQCQVHAINLSDGSKVWNAPIKPGSTCPGAYYTERSTPMVADGAVFAADNEGSVALDAATGAVRWRSGARSAGGDGAGAIANGLWILANGSYDDGSMVALDVVTGEVLWRNGTIPGAMRFSVAGDLIVARGPYSLKGYSLIDGQEVWDGGTPESKSRQSGAAAISGGRIFINTFDGVKAYGLP